MSEFDALIDDNTAAPQPSVANPQTTMQQPSGSDAAPSFDSLQSDEEKYGTPEQKLKTGVEGAAKGILGPAVPLIERALNVHPEDIRGRAETNPITHAVTEATGLGASLLSGVGQGALIGEAGAGVKALSGLGKAAEVAEGAKEAGILSKVGAEAIDQATQMALFQGSDEVSKMLLNDPSATSENAIANIGLAAALGGATGAGIGAISPLWKATGIGQKAGKLLGEFKDELKYIHENPDPIMQATKELDAMHMGTQDLKESLYMNGVKGDVIREHLPEITPKTTEAINGQVKGITNILDDAIKFSEKNPRLSSSTKVLEYEKEQFLNKIAKSVDSETPYEAINDLKKIFQKDAKYDKLGVPSAYNELAAKLAKDIRPLLEDEEVWGKAGNVQKLFNEAYTTFENSKAEKDFLKTFTNDVAGERVLNPAKVNTFANQAGKPNAEIKNEILENYIKEHQAFADKINGIMTKLGKEPIVESPSLNTIKKLMGEKTKGAELAQSLVKKLGDNVAGKVVGAGTGSAIGSLVGHPYMGAIAGEHALSPLLEPVFKGLTKSIMESAVAGNAFKSSLDYGMMAAKANKVINTAVKGVFKPGAIVLASHLVPDMGSREKLDKVVDSMTKNPTKVTQIDNGQLGHYLPNHQTALTESTIRAGQYLAQIKPRAYQSSPLDKPIEPTKAQMQRYNRALDIAQQPAVVLQHIKDGTLQSSDVQDISHMYPSLYQQMVSKISTEMMNHTAKEGPIPYKTRVGMSLFMGQALDTSMQPQSIMTNQMAFKGAASPQQQTATGQKHSGSSSKLGKTNASYMTPSQAREAARTKG